MIRKRALNRHLSVALGAVLLTLPSPLSALDVPSQEQLETMCNTKGGQGFLFGQTDIPLRATDGEAFPLTSPLGMFSTLELWTTSRSNQLMVLRYEVATDGDQSKTINDALAPNLLALGWELASADYDRPLYAQGSAPLWLKNILVDGEATEVLIQIDGGIETSSLYCSRADLMRKNHAELFNSVPEKKEPSDPSQIVVAASFRT